MKMTIDNLKLNRIIEYIRTQPFEFERDEVKDDLYFVLRYYKVYDTLSAEEGSITIDELIKFADAYETNEAFLMAEKKYKCTNGKD